MCVCTKEEKKKQTRDIHVISSVTFYALSFYVVRIEINKKRAKPPPTT